MAKLTILAALLAALIAFASATTYTTVVTTVTDMDNPETCQEETQKIDTKACRAWFMQAGRGGGSFSVSLRGNPEMGPEMCCSELSRVSSKCRCEAIRMSMKEAQQKYGEMTGMEQMREMAESLPRMCRWQSPTHCTMRAEFY